MKSQIGLEYLFLISFFIVGIAGIVNYSSKMIADSNNQNYMIYILNDIKNAVSEVGFMGYPARKTIDVYLPADLNSSQTFIGYNTVNFGLISSFGTSDLFFVTDYCVTGNLPTQKGLYPLKVVPTKDCIVIDYNDFSSNPSSIYLALYKNSNSTLSLSVYNLLFYDLSANITLSENLADFADLNLAATGKQSYLELGTFYSGDEKTIDILFFGYSPGIYKGHLTINNTNIPVILEVKDSEPPTINYVSISNISIVIYDSACISASVTPGSEQISNVWAELKIPGGCWEKNGECDSSCEYSSLGQTNYYSSTECSQNCMAEGSFYLPTGTCSNDGSGTCYSVSNFASHNISCLKGMACNYSCFGTGTNCSELNNSDCALCGCNLTQELGNSIIWSENFESSIDWSPWAARGIVYTTDSANCINDDNDKCVYINRGTTSYILTKQSSIDLSSCVSGAYLNFSHIKESGNLQTTDCVYVSISNDGGSTWSNNYQLFCDDLASLITYNLSIPSSYLTPNFAVRISKNGFSPASRKAWIDGLSISCNNIVQNCNGICNNCSLYSNESSCNLCGCGWNETSWNWMPADLQQGYSSYEQCAWNPNGTHYLSNITLYDSGYSCSGIQNDGIYGFDYIFQSKGEYALLSAYANDSSSNIAYYESNITIIVNGE